MNPNNDAQPDSAGLLVDPNDTGAVLALFSSIGDRAAGLLSANTDWSASGRRESQYVVDVAIDAMCLDALHSAGLAVLSEESGVTAPNGSVVAEVPDVVVVVDPLDGSTNAALGVPWCATALCLVVGGAGQVALVRNLRSDDVFTATRGGGAYRRHRRISVGPPVSLGDAIIAANARPPEGFAARQFRCMGSTALDIATIGDRGFDGYVDFDHDMIGVWDYLASTLIVEEAGGVCADALGRDLVVLDHAARRRPVVASSRSLLDELLAVG